MTTTAVKEKVDDGVRLLSVRQVAELLSIHQRSIWRMAACGQLPRPVKIGGCTRWRLKDLQAWVEKLED